MEDKELKEGLVNVMDSLLSGFKAESVNKYGDYALQLIEENKHLDIKNPEYFHLLKATSVDEISDIILDEAITHLNPLLTDRQTRSKVVFIYNHYDFIKQHLLALMTPREGSACSTDTTRWLTEQYRLHVLHDKCEEIPEERKYWHPKAGEMSDWIEFMDTMIGLYYGDILPYSMAKINLIGKY